MNPLSHNKALHDDEWTCVVTDKPDGGLPLSRTKSQHDEMQDEIIIAI